MLANTRGNISPVAILPRNCHVSRHLPLHPATSAMADAGADYLLRCPRCHRADFTSPTGRDMHYAHWCPLLPHWRPTRYRSANMVAALVPAQYQALFIGWLHAHVWHLSCTTTDHDSKQRDTAQSSLYCTRSAIVCMHLPVVTCNSDRHIKFNNHSYFRLFTCLMSSSHHQSETQKRSVTCSVLRIEQGSVHWRHQVCRQQCLHCTAVVWPINCV